MEWTAVSCSDWSARNPANLYSFVASNVGDRAVEWRIIDFQFVRQQPKPCRPYAEKVKSPDRVVIQDQGVSFMLLYLVLRLHCFDFVLRKIRNEVSEAEPEFQPLVNKAGWSWGCVSAGDSNGRTIWIVDAHRCDGKRFVVRADEKLTAFMEPESGSSRVSGKVLQEYLATPYWTRCGRFS